MGMEVPRMQETDLGINPEVLAAVDTTIARKCSDMGLFFIQDGQVSSIDAFALRERILLRLRKEQPMLVRSANRTVRSARIRFFDYDGTLGNEDGMFLGMETGLDAAALGREGEAEKMRTRRSSMVAIPLNGIEAHYKQANAYQMLALYLDHLDPATNITPEMYATLYRAFIHQAEVCDAIKPRMNAIISGRSEGELELIQRKVEKFGGRVSWIGAEDGVVQVINNEILRNPDGTLALEELNIALFETFLLAKGIDKTNAEAVERGIARFIELQERGCWKPVVNEDTVSIYTTEARIDAFGEFIMQAKEVAAHYGHDMRSSLEKDAELARMFGNHVGHTSSEVTAASLQRVASALVMMPEDPATFEMIQRELETLAEDYGLELRTAHTQILEVHVPSDNKSLAITLAQQLSEVMYGVEEELDFGGNKRNDLAAVRAVQAVGGRTLLVANEMGQPYLQPHEIPPGTEVADKPNVYALIDWIARNTYEDLERQVRVLN